MTNVVQNIFLVFYLEYSASILNEISKQKQANTRKEKKKLIQGKRRRNGDKEKRGKMIKTNIHCRDPYNHSGIINLTTIYFSSTSKPGKREEREKK